MTLRRAWEQALRSLSTRVNKPTLESHIRHIRPVSLTQTVADGVPVCEITLGVPSAFTREWIEKRHAPVIAQVLEETLDCTVSLQFVLSSPESATSRTGQTALPFDSVPEAPTKNKTRSAAFADASRSATPDTPKLDFGQSEQLSGPATSPVLSPSATLVSGPETPVQTVPERRVGLDAPVRIYSPSVARQSTSGAGQSAMLPSPDAPPLNPRYTFDTFVVGPSNRLAYAGAKAVAESPGQVYNPLFLYGAPGLGKTHLMHAIGHEIVARSGDGVKKARVAYVSAEAFTTQFLATLRDKKNSNAASDFSRRWRSVDVWLVDDVQFITGKERTNEEFFHTFNSLYQTGKQIVISSDRSPRELKAMEERLRSRFESGLIADVAPPDLETRLAILQRKADSERARISDDVLLYIAELVQSNIRTLEGALVKLIASASLTNAPITRPLAQNVLERYFGASLAPDPLQPTRSQTTQWTNVVSGTSATSGTGVWSANRGTIAGGGGDTGTGGGRERTPAPPSSARTNVGKVYSGTNSDQWGGLKPGGRGVTPDVIQTVVARHFGLDPDALTGKRRDRDVTTARQIAIHLTRELTDVNLPGIGQFFGGRDHTSVTYACERIRDQIRRDDELRGLVEHLKTQVRAQASGI